MVKPSNKRRGSKSTLRRVRKRAVSVTNASIISNNSHIDDIIEDVILESRRLSSRNPIRILSPDEINANYDNAINEAIEEIRRTNDLNNPQPPPPQFETVYLEEARSEKQLDNIPNEEDPLTSTAIIQSDSCPLEADEEYWEFIRAITSQFESTNAQAPSLDENFIKALDEFLDEYIRLPTASIETELAEFSRELEQQGPSMIDL